MAYEIDTTTETLNESLREAECALIALNLGAEASEEMVHDNYELRALAFRKTGEGWRLVVEEVDSDGERTIPLLSASRDVRIAAAAKLDALLTQLLALTHGRLKDLRAAVDQVESFRERLAREGKS